MLMLQLINLVCGTSHCCWHRPSTQLTVYINSLFHVTTDVEWPHSSSSCLCRWLWLWSWRFLRRSARLFCLNMWLLRPKQYHMACSAKSTKSAVRILSSRLSIPKRLSPLVCYQEMYSLSSIWKCLYHLCRPALICCIYSCFPTLSTLFLNSRFSDSDCW